MHIPLIKPDLPRIEELEDSFREVLSNGKITNFSKYVQQFEQEAGEYLGVSVVSTSSGTAGLILTLQAMGLKAGQKVIVPSFTFMATAQAVLYAGGIPVFAECRDDLTLDVDDLVMLLQTHSDVAVVMPVHIYGLPCQVDEIKQVVDKASAQRNKPIRILYDAAHGFGASLNGTRVGNFGDAEVFSLSVTKVLVTVEGGLVASHNPEILYRLQKMRNYGIESNYNALYQGINSKMSEFHAIVGLYNIRRIGALMEERQEKAHSYSEKIRACTGFELIPLPPNVEHTFKDFTVMMPAQNADKRDAVIEHLKARGIETRPYFSPPVHEQAYFRPYADRALPRTEALARRVITLPFYTTITDDEINYVVNALRVAERTLL